MSRSVVRVALLTVFTLLGVASAGFARAAAVAIDDVARDQLVPSAAPALLGPINELGRDGWHCVPEQSATARHAGAAELPQPDGP